MNFAHHVPAEQNFTHHTLVNVVLLVAVVVLITGVAVALNRRKMTEQNKNEEE